MHLLCVLFFYFLLFHDLFTHFSKQRYSYLMKRKESFPRFLPKAEVQAKEGSTGPNNLSLA